MTCRIRHEIMGRTYFLELGQSGWDIRPDSIHGKVRACLVKAPRQGVKMALFDYVFDTDGGFHGWAEAVEDPFRFITEDGYRLTYNSDNRWWAAGDFYFESSTEGVPVDQHGEHVPGRFLKETE